MKKGDLRRQAILDTAEALFFERGYEETSVQDILDAMELSKGGFYHHFESKNGRAGGRQRPAARNGSSPRRRGSCAPPRWGRWKSSTASSRW